MLCFGIVRQNSYTLSLYSHIIDVLLECGKSSVALLTIAFTAFGYSLGALKKPDFSPQWNDAIEGTAESAPLTKQMSGIVQYLQKLPLPVIRYLHPNLGRLLGLRLVCCGRPLLQTRPLPALGFREQSTDACSAGSLL